MTIIDDPDRKGERRVNTNYHGARRYTKTLEGVIEGGDWRYKR